MLILLPVVGLPIIATGYVLKLRGHEAIVEEKQGHLQGLNALLAAHLQAQGGYHGLLAEYRGDPADREAKIRYLNGRLHGFTDAVAQAFPEVGVGFFHRGLEAIITYGPSAEYGKTVGITIPNDHPGWKVMGSGLPMTVSGGQVRGNIMNAMRPIEENGQVVGYIWANELIDAIRNKNNISTTEFREKYRNNDVLLIDDIQFIIGKESTQEEFFHTFNELHEAKKQIVISSDKHPREIATLEERLRSRFEWGITADIQPPDYETKMAILKKRAELEHLDINQEVMQYVATNINSNIRELEGALNKIYVFANLEKKPVTLELAENALKDTIECQKEVTPQLIMDVVAEHYNISVSDIISKKKNKEIANPRQICMYLSRKYTDYSLQNIGKIMGNRDHTTVIHGHDKIGKMLETDENLKSNLDIIIKKLNPPT